MNTLRLYFLPMASVLLSLTLQLIPVKAVSYIYRETPVDSIVSSATFVDDFSLPSDAWRFGNAVVSKGQSGVVLDGRNPEATLSGTALHPGNLQSFRATVRWSFSPKGQPVLYVGWGKPQEWDPFDDCQASFSIDRGGHVVLMAGKQVLGKAQLAVPADSIYELSFSQEHAGVVLHTAGGDQSFSFPGGARPRTGYFMLRAQDMSSGRSEWSIRMRGVEIGHRGENKPMNEEERNGEIQSWAKAHLDANEAVLERFKSYIESETVAGRWGYQTDITVSPGLVQHGEAVTVTFRTKGPVPSPCTAYMKPDFLSATPGNAVPVKLDWQSDPQGGHIATVTLVPQKMGNWRVVWQVGEEKLSRVFAVIGSGYMVARLLFTNYKGPWTPGHLPGAYDVAHEYGIASDYWSGDEWASPFGRTPEALLNRFGFFSRNRHLWGDRVMPMVNANWLFPGCMDANLFRFDEEVQHEGIGQISRLWNMMGLGPLEIMATYTPGHNTPRIARELGVKVLDSFCQWQNWRDGGSDNSWLINDVGAPALPYYIADDDFRKIASGQSILAFTQNTNSNVRLYDIMTAEGQPQLNFRRTHGNEMGETSNIDRFETVVDLWLAEASYQKEPLFTSIGLENFVDSKDWNEANKLGVRYLREQARNKKLVFVSAVDVAEYFEQHYATQPENWIVWPDTYAGQAGGYKPRQLPDRIEISNAQFHSVHENGKALPQFFWDYTLPWSEPVWDDQKVVRLKYGLVDPELITADNCVPRMVNLSNVRAKVEQKTKEGEIGLTITVYSEQPVSLLPVATWNVCLDPKELAVEESSPGARYIPVVDGSTGNAHGVMVCNNVPAGASTWTVRLKGQPRTIINPDVAIGDYVRGRMFIRNSIPNVYLWLAETAASEGVLHIQVPAGRKASVHYNDGEVVESLGGDLLVSLVHDWQHESPLVTGLTGTELQAFSTFEPSK